MDIFRQLRTIFSRKESTSPEEKSSKEAKTLASGKLIESLKLHEGFRSKPYRDSVGKLTIGYGRNLDDVGLTLAEKEFLGIRSGKQLFDGISQKEAEVLLLNDITRAKVRLFTALPWVQKLDDVRQNVLIEMAFNLGVHGLLGFRNTLSAIEAGRFTDASKRMLRSKWAAQVGQRAVTLSEMMRTGKFPS